MLQSKKASTSLHRIFLLSLFLFAFVSKSSAIFLDPRIPLAINLPADFSSPTNKYLLAITDKAELLGTTFGFQSHSNSIPRIVHSRLFSGVSGVLGTQSVPPLQLSQPGALTFHYLKAEAGAQNIFGITAFDTMFTYDFPSAGDSFAMSTNDVNALGSLDQYETIIYSTIIEHDRLQDITCKYTIEYSGVIRGVFFDDNHRMNWKASSIDYQTVITGEFGPVELKAKRLTWVTVTGRSLNLQRISFSDCEQNGVSVTPTFTYYYPGAAVQAPEEYTFSVNTTYCEQYATKCLNSDYSLKCDQFHVRENGKCKSLCSDATPNVNRVGDCVPNPPEDFSIAAFTPSPGSDSFAMDIKLDAPAGSNFLLVLSSGALPSGTAPLLYNNQDPSPAFATAQSSLHTYSGGLDSISGFCPPTGDGGADAFKLGVQLFDIVNDNNKTMIVKQYPNKPTSTKNTILEYDELYYAKYDEAQNLHPNKWASIDTVLNCDGFCKINIFANGKLQAFENFQTLVADVIFGSQAWTVTLTKQFSGVVILNFQLEGSSTFKLEVDTTDPFELFTTSNFRMRTEITLDGSASYPCGYSDCLNCDYMCYSCNTGFYLDDMGSCSDKCVGMYPRKSILERTCVSSCDSSQVQSGSTDCLPKCGEQGKYYIEGLGCVGGCPLGCDLCSSSTECMICHSGTTLQTDKTCLCDDPSVYFVSGMGCVGECPFQCVSCQDSTTCLTCSSMTTKVGTECQCNAPRVNGVNDCECPAGMVENPITLNCETIPATVETHELDVSLGDDMVIWPAHEVSPADIFTAVYRWKIVSTSTNSALTKTLYDYVDQQTGPILFIPSTYFEVGVQYTISFFYGISTAVDLVEIHKITTSAGETPQINMNGGYFQTRSRAQSAIIKAETIPSLWTLDASALTITWSQTSGDIIDLNSFKQSPEQFWLEIPKCALKMGKSYGLKITLDLPGMTQPSDSEALITVPVEVNIEIPENSKTHLFNENLLIAPVLKPADDCGDTNINDLIVAATAQYVWTCTKIDINGVESNCLDPLNYFNTPRSTISLNVDNSYFTGETGNIFVFEVTALLTAYNGVPVSLKTYTSFTIINPTNLKISLTSSDGDSQNKFSNNEDIIFTADIESGLDPSLTYQWVTNPSVPHVFYMNKLKVFGNSMNFRSSTNEFLTVTFKAISGSNENSVFFKIPINTEPTGGSLQVFPSSGYSMDTNFYISAMDWKDEDLPLSYVFSYSYHSNGKYKDLSDKQGDPYIFTQLVAPIAGDKVYLKVNVFDSLNAMSSEKIAVSVTKPLNGMDLIAEAKQRVDLTTIFDPFVSFNKLALLFQNLDNWIDTKLDETSPGCPGCSGNGVCENNKCVCNPGFYLDDCSFETAENKDVTDTKLYLAQKSDEALNRAKAQRMKGSLMDSINKMTKSSAFTQNTTLEGFQTILASLMDNEKTTILNGNEPRDLADILDNFLTYAAETDCGIETTFTKNLENITKNYLETVSISTLNNKIPHDYAFAFQTNNFHVYTQKIALCEISTLSFTTGPQTPILQFFPQNNSAFTPEDCLTEITIKYYLFENQIFNCENKGRLLTTSDKSYIALEIKEVETGKEVENLEAVIQMPTDTCPEGCNKFDESTKLCRCPSLKVFDAEKKISDIFKNSRADYITNIQALTQSIYKNVALWSLFTFLVWFLITLYLVKKRMYNYCILEYTKVSAKNNLAKIKLLILTTHPLTGIYLYKNPYISKSRRTVLYYTRMSLLLAYSSLFTNLNGKQEINLFYIFLNYVTVFPIYSILHYLLQGIKEDEKDAHRGKSIRYRRYIGTVLAVTVLIACTLISLIISAQLTTTQRVAWVTYLIISLIQDIFCTPFIFLTIRLCIIYAFNWNFHHGKPIAGVILYKFMNKKLKLLYERIFHLEYSKTKNTESSFKKESQKSQLGLRIFPLELKQANSLTSSKNTPISNPSSSGKNQGSTLAGMPSSTKALDPWSHRDSENFEEASNKDSSKMEKENVDISPGPGQKTPVVRFNNKAWGLYKNLLLRSESVYSGKGMDTPSELKNIILLDDKDFEDSQKGDPLMIFKKQDWSNTESMKQGSMDKFELNEEEFENYNIFLDSFKSRLSANPESNGGSDKTKEEGKSTFTIEKSSFNTEKGSLNMDGPKSNSLTPKAYYHSPPKIKSLRGKSQSQLKRIFKDVKFESSLQSSVQSNGNSIQSSGNKFSTHRYLSKSNSKMEDSSRIDLSNFSIEKSQDISRNEKRVIGSKNSNNEENIEVENL